MRALLLLLLLGACGSQPAVSQREAAPSVRLGGNAAAFYSFSR